MMAIQSVKGTQASMDEKNSNSAVKTTVSIPALAYRRIKMAAAARDITMGEMLSIALDEWAAEKVAGREIE